MRPWMLAVRPPIAVDRAAVGLYFHDLMVQLPIPPTAVVRRSHALMLHEVRPLLRVGGRVR
jgi:hypothetical protein